MKRIIYVGIIMMGLGLVGLPDAHAIEGIKDVSECKGNFIKDTNVLKSALNNLNPIVNPYFQNDKFIFCMSENGNDTKAPISVPTTLTNSSIYPVVIYQLNVKSTSAQLGQSLLTVKGNILLQNLKAEGLRGPVILDGGASLSDSKLSCDGNLEGFSVKPTLQVIGSNSKITDVTIDQCYKAITVTGTGNTLTDIKVTFDKTQTPFLAGHTGITLAPGKNILKGSVAWSNVSGETKWSSEVIGYETGVVLEAGVTGVASQSNTPSAAVSNSAISPSAGFSSKLGVSAGTAANIGIGGPGAVILSAAKNLKIGDPSASPQDDKSAAPNEKLIGSTVKIARVEGQVLMGTDTKLLSSAVAGGVWASGSNILISKSMLGNDHGGPAVSIGQNPATEKAWSPVKITQCTYTTENTIAYVDESAQNANILFDTGMMGVEHSKADPNVIDRVIGRLLNQNSNASAVELHYLNPWDKESTQYKLAYKQNCKIYPTAEKIVFNYTAQDGTVSEKFIEIGDKVFDCSTTKNSPTLNLKNDNHVRFLTNSPTVSVMSDDVKLADLNTRKPTVLAAQPGTMVETTGLGEAAEVNVVLAGGDAGTLDSGAGSGPVAVGGGGGGSSDVTVLVPSGPSSMGTNGSPGSVTQLPNLPGPDDAEGSSVAPGGNATADGVSLGGEVPVAIADGAGSAGASTGLIGGLASGKSGCSLIPGIAAPDYKTSALLWLLMLLPLPILVPLRGRLRR